MLFFLLSMIPLLSIQINNPEKSLKQLDHESGSPIRVVVKKSQSSAEFQNVILSTREGINIYLTFRIFPRINQGEVYDLNCRLKDIEITSKPGFDAYLLSKGVSYTCSFPKLFKKVGKRDDFFVWFSDIKTGLENNFQKIYPEPYASIVSGMTIGSAPNLPDFVDKRFKETGLTHILVVSGSNITLVLGLLFFLLKGLHKKYQIIFAGSGAILYTLLIGLDPPALRALFMGILGLGAIILGRDFSAERILFIFGLLSLTINPYSIYDAGFLLSFFATLGIILFSQIFIFKEKNVFKEVLVSTVAASIFTVPVTIYYFDSFSIFGLFYNLIVLPLVPFVTIYGFLTLLVSFFWIDMAVFMGFLNYMVLDFVLTLAGLN